MWVARSQAPSSLQADCLRNQLIGSNRTTELLLRLNVSRYAHGF